MGQLLQFPSGNNPNSQDPIRSELRDIFGSLNSQTERKVDPIIARQKLIADDIDRARKYRLDSSVLFREPSTGHLRIISDISKTIFGRSLLAPRYVEPTVDALKTEESARVGAKIFGERPDAKRCEFFYDCTDDEKALWYYYQDNGDKDITVGYEIGKIGVVEGSVVEGVLRTSSDPSVPNVIVEVDVREHRNLMTAIDEYHKGVMFHLYPEYSPKVVHGDNNSVNAQDTDRLAA